MEFVERALGITRRRQKKLVSELGIAGELEEEFIGPEYIKASVVKVDEEQFRLLLHSRKPLEVVSRIVHRSDTHVLYGFYIELGEGVMVKTEAASIDYSNERTLLNDLDELSYRYESMKPKHEHGSKDWGVYQLEAIEGNS